MQTLTESTREISLDQILQEKVLKSAKMQNTEGGNESLETVTRAAFLCQDVSRHPMKRYRQLRCCTAALPAWCINSLATQNRLFLAADRYLDFTCNGRRFAFFILMLLLF